MHQTHIRVRGYHLDVFQHVNNARYLEFLEEARWSYFEDTGLTPLFMEGDLAMAVVNININYRRAALLGDDLLIRTRFETVNERHAVIAQEVVFRDSGKVAADATVVFVAVDKRSNRAVAFGGAMKDALDALAAEGRAA